MAADRGEKSFRFAGLAKAGALFFAVLLVYLTVSSLRQAADIRDYLQKELEKRLTNLSEGASRELEGKYPDVVRDSYPLFAMTVKESLVSVALYDRRGLIVAGTSAAYGKGGRRGEIGIEGQAFEDVWRGKVVVSPVYKKSGMRVRSAYFPVKDANGATVAVGEVTLEAGHIEELTQEDTTFFFLKSMVLVFLILVSLYLFRSLIISQRRLARTAKKGDVRAPGDNVSFAMSAVVSSLKEKEREIEDLRRKAEERARYIESYNENILRSIQSGVMTFDAQGTVITANAAAEAMLDKGSGVLNGKADSEIFGEGSWICGLITKTLAEGRPERRGEGEVNTGRRVMWLGAGTSPLVGAGGTSEGTILVFTDITEVKELRERMELKERMTALGEMSGGIAHEMRNPMGVISGYAEFLSRRLSGDAESRDAVANIQAEIRVMDEIIREFMAFSQPTELNITDVDVPGLMDESLKALAGIGDDVKREVVVEDGLPHIEGDLVLLRQAFINIIRNSLESMPEGGLLSVSARKVELEGSGYISVEVSDTGAGIAEDDIKKIFTPFFTTKEKGTGLGLALVQKILVYHGGRATVRSLKGKGTTFSVLLPVKSSERARI